MQLELRVCQHCYDGEHGNDHKTAVTRDMVDLARTVDDHREAIGLEAVTVRMVEEDEPGKPAALPVVAASIQNDEVVVSDTQLVTQDQNGYMLLYRDPSDVLYVLLRNVDQISKTIEAEIPVDLSPESVEVLPGEE